MDRVLAVNTSKSTSFTAWGFTGVMIVSQAITDAPLFYYFTCIILSRNMLDIAYHAIQRTMETMIIRRRQPENSNTTTIKGFCPFGGRIYVEEVGHSEFVAFNPIQSQRM
jgi:hypothetical protein